MNTLGSYRCTCKPGYVPDPTFIMCIRKSSNQFFITVAHSIILDREDLMELRQTEQKILALHLHAGLRYADLHIQIFR